MPTVKVQTYDDKGNLVTEHDLEIPAESVNRDAVEATARSALAANRTFVALASPSAAQSTAQVKALSRQVNGLIRVLLGAFDGSD